MAFVPWAAGHRRHARPRLRTSATTVRSAEDAYAAELLAEPVAPGAGLVAAIRSPSRQGLAPD